MAMFTVFSPRRTIGDIRRDGLRYRFSRHGFAWLAMIFGPLWLLWHRMWLMTLAYLVLAVGIGILGTYGEAGGTASTVLSIMLAILLGFEAQGLLRWTLRRKGWREEATVVARSRPEAESRYFEALAAATAKVPGASAATTTLPAIRQPTQPAPARSAADEPEIIGLFPTPEPTR
jgi:hypothetical protein